MNKVMREMMEAIETRPAEYSDAEVLAAIDEVEGLIDQFNTIQQRAVKLVYPYINIEDDRLEKILGKERYDALNAKIDGVV